MLVAVSMAVLAWGGPGAARAAAAPSCPNDEVPTVQGQGASLQRLAQARWVVGYASFCGVHPAVSYASTSSAEALGAFRFIGTGDIENGTHAGEGGAWSFGASDEPPTASQIVNAEEATLGGAASGANALIIPVAQTAIAVVVHPPSGCTLTTNTTHGISYVELSKIFNGTLKTWSELASHSGTCGGSVVRVVPSDGAGTTFQFKNYLSDLETNSSIHAPGPGCVYASWAVLRPIEDAATGAPNTVWPECAGATSVKRKEGDAGVAAYVAAAEGTIGYVSLPEAKAAGDTVARLQNQTAPVYALPEGSTGETANCGSRVYTVPTPGREGETGESVDWSGVFGAAPAIGGTLYPLCTLTYALSWSSYEKAGYTSPSSRAEDVKDYISYILNEGQSIGHYYQALPSPAEKEHNVLAAAKLAASKIG